MSSEELELDQELVKGALPPLIVTSIEPVDCPKHETSEIVSETVIGKGEPTTNAPTTVHPDTLSFTLTVYVPTERPEIELEFAPFDHEMI